MGELGCGAVRTYIASGNVIFTSQESARARLVDRVEPRLAEAFGFAVPTTLRTAAELRAELAASPFVDRQPAVILAFAENQPS